MLQALPPVFAGVPPEIANEAARFLAPARFEPGDVVLVEGEEDDALAFVLSGSLEVSARGVALGHVGQRELLGEVEFFGGMRRIASAVATTVVELLVLSPSDFLSLRDAQHPVAYHIERAVLRRLGERLIALDDQIRSFVKGQDRVPTPTQRGFLERVFQGKGRRPEAATLDVLGALQGSTCFSAMPPDQLRQISGWFQPVSREANEAICRQGESPEDLFLMLSGKADVLLELGDGFAETLARVEPGQVFGDSSMALGTPRFASVYARDDVQLLALTRPRYLELYQLDAPLGSAFRTAMIHNLIHQLVGASTKVVSEHMAAELRARQDIRAGGVWRD